VSGDGRSDGVSGHNEVILVLEHEPLAREIVGAATEVHRALGPGLLEDAYVRCLAHELSTRGLNVEQGVPLKLKYKDAALETDYRVDLLVASKVVVEVECAAAITPELETKLMTHLRLGGFPVGLLFNFNVVRFRDGIMRRVNTHTPGGSGGAGGAPAGGKA
jgi:GxxExxY protein